MGENEKGSAATVSGTPRSLISLKSIEKALQIKDFIKSNRTPTKIRIVSKLVSGFGAGEGTCRLLRLRLAYLWLADRCFATVPGSPLLAKNSPPDCFFTLRPSRVQDPLKIKKSRCCDSFYLKVKTYFDTKFTRHRPFIKGFTHR